MIKRTLLITTMTLTLFLASCASVDNKPTPTPTQAQTQGNSVTKNGLTIEGNVSKDLKVTTNPAPTPPPAVLPKTKGVAISAAGFMPNNLTITPGTTVIFQNTDTEPHWPASDPHPTHTICPGFDALKGLAKGETYSFTFTEAKTCSYHDHLNPSTRGTITVK